MFEYNCVVKKIVDGDTMDVDIDLGFGIWKIGQRVRLNGVDTPESRTTDSLEKKYGLIAKKFVENYLSLNQPVRIITVKEKSVDKEEKYGRILADFFVLDPSTKEYRKLTDLLVENNLAVRYEGQSKELIREEHLKNQKVLKQKGL